MNVRKVSVSPLVLLLSLLLTISCRSAVNESSSSAFFREMSGMCGQSFRGSAEFVPPGDTTWTGAELEMGPLTCTAEQIRIPLRVGTDRSRTWILTKTAAGLLFKHDHRHADGTPDAITDYGGPATAAGTRFHQSFPADAETAALIPAAATNVWEMIIDRPSVRFVYKLSRDGKPRFRAAFSLGKAF